MTEETQDPMAAATEPQKYHVLVMTAAVITCEASSEIEAAQRSLIEGPSILDPKQLQWVVKYVSDKPIYLGDPEEMGEDAVVEDAPTTPKLEIVK